MIYIHENDLPKVMLKIEQAIISLNNGANRVDSGIDVGEQIDVLRIVAYRIGDNVIRIDIK